MYTFLSDSQSRVSSHYVVKILLHLSLNVLIKKKIVIKDLKKQHFQIPIRSGLLSSTLSWASGSGDCASTPRVIDIKFDYFLIYKSSKWTVETTVNLSFFMH